MQLPVAITAAQNIFNETALMWEDRQTEVRASWRQGWAPVIAAGADLPTKAPRVVAPASTSFGSVWLKGIGSWTKRDNVVGVSTSFSGDPNVDLGYKQDTYGFIGGLTMGVENLFHPGDAVVGGPMAGYIESKVRFNSNGTTMKFTGGTGGVSLGWLYGGFFVDALAKVDFLTMKTDMPALASAGFGGLPNADLWTYGFVGNVGYRWDFRNNFFFEPLGTLVYAKTHFNNLSTLQGLGADINFADGESLRGAIGARAGVSIPNWGGRRVEVSILGRAWDELKNDNNGVTLVSQGGNVELTDNFTKSFGEVKAGIDVFGRPGQWGAFLNAGVKFNDQFYTVTAKGGFNYQFSW